MFIIFVFLIVSLGFYSFTIIKLVIGVNKLKLCNDDIKKTVSVIIAAKNEERNIKKCVDALINQTYPQSLYEIIIVDDHSEDNTYNLLMDNFQHHPIVKILRNRYSGSKKNALLTGIETANGEILLFTDADCIPPAEWISQIVACFTPATGIVAGFSPLVDKTDSLPGRLIELDSLVAATIAAGGIGNNFPITCTARNFAYRKQVFQEVGGYNEILHSISGDDDLFLHLVKRKTNWQIKYCIAAQAVVPGYQTKRWYEFFLQKKRHISASKYYPRKLQFFYGVMHLINTTFYLVLVTAIFFNDFLLAAVTFFILKLIADFLFIYQGAKIFQRKKLIKYFLLWEPFYLIYNLIIGPAAMIGKIKWGNNK